MGEIIDFQIMKCEFLRHKVRKTTEMSDGRAARVRWLKMTGGSLAEVVKASLDAAEASRDCTKYEQTLAFLTHNAQAEPVS